MQTIWIFVSELLHQGFSTHKKKKEKKMEKKNPYYYNMVCGLDKYTNPAPKSKYIYILMMPKRSPASHTVLARSKQCLHNKKRKPNRKHRCGASQISSKGQVRTFVSTLECQSWGKLCVPVFWGFLGFYSSVESSSKTCVTSLFLIEKISINVRKFLNPPYVSQTTNPISIRL